MSLSRQTIYREDVRKTNSEFYSLRDKKMNYYDIPEMNYLVSSGHGVHSIYDMYDFKDIWTIGRFINRVKHYTVKSLNKNFSRMPLEMEWGEDTEIGKYYIAMMWVPSYISEELFNKTMKDLQERLGKMDFKIAMTRVPKRRCAQLLHEGSYQTIDTTKQNLLNELHKEGYSPIGNPQEIYMNHPHCNPPEKLKILLRQEI
jgi:hypothetical protein